MSTQVKVARIVFASEDFFKEESSRVFVELWELGKHSHRTSNARLKPDSQILERYERWRKAYKSFYQHLSLRDEFDPKGAINRMRGDELIELQALKKNLSICSSDLVTSFNHWLSSQPSFRDGVENWLGDRFNLEDSEIRIAIESDDPNVRRLPWQAWNLLGRFDQAELSIGDTRHDSRRSVPLNTGDSRHLKLLAVFGYEGGLDLERDRKTIQSLANVESEFLYQPTLQELKAKLRRSRWDSLYFGGHSASNKDGKTGVLYLNSQEPIEISQLKGALKTAVRDGGLQLGIFNSCDGLGLAAELEDVHFPLSIVMREPVPNEVAQRFLKYFLQAFTRGKPLYLALRQARLLLEDDSEELPYVSWLPAIAHDSSTNPLLWQDGNTALSVPVVSESSHSQGQPSAGLERSTTVVRPPRPNADLQAPSAPKTILGGAYEILDSLSSGGFSVTYLARALELPGKPKCAIKQLKPMSPKIDLAKAREWFELEAQILFELGSSTDRIPTFYARFEEGGEFYLVQEFIDGEELEKELRARGRLSEFETLELLHTILDGLEIVHRKSIIHRDIKPSNLMRRKSDGKIVLIDFGAVKEVIALATQTGAEFRRQGSIVGSPGFMAPEQSSGYPLQASDIFSVGAIALRAVTGIAPVQVFSAEGKTGRLIRQDSVQLTEEMADLLNSMTHVDPEQRFVNASEALKAVKQLMQAKERDSIVDTEQYGQPSSFADTGQTGGMANSGDRFSVSNSQSQGDPRPRGNFFNRLFGGRNTPDSPVEPKSPSSASFSVPEPLSNTGQEGEPVVDETVYLDTGVRQQYIPSGQSFGPRPSSQPGYSATLFDSTGTTSSPQAGYELLKDKLNAVLGPMGTMVLNQALSEASTVGDVIARIARSMPPEQQAPFQNWAAQTVTQLPLTAGQSTSTGEASSPSFRNTDSTGASLQASSPLSTPSNIEHPSLAEKRPGSPPPIGQRDTEQAISPPIPPSQLEPPPQAEPVSITSQSFQNSMGGSELAGVTLSQQQAEQLRQKLAENLGPMARVTINNALSSSNSRQEFIDALTKWLPPDSQLSFRDFAVTVLSQSSEGNAPQYDRNSSTVYFDRPQTNSGVVGAATWAQDSAFLSFCQTELAKHIGPIAAIAIKQALNNHAQGGARDAFIQELTSHVSNPNSATSFKQALQQR